MSNIQFCNFFTRQPQKPQPNPCAWCGRDRNDETRMEGDPLCCCPHQDGIFVFGSNCVGVHGAGAAAHAHKVYGAEFGVGFGMTGQSYAIPTKDENIETMPIDMIIPFVQEFLDFAVVSPSQTFLVTRIGCGLAGYADEDIAPLFIGAPTNCLMPIEWRLRWPEYFGHLGPR